MPLDPAILAAFGEQESQASLAPAKDTTSLLKGLVINTPVNAVKGIVTSGANLLQSVNPTEMNVPFASIPIPQTTPDRVYEAVNAVLLGIPEVAKNRWKRENEAQGPPVGVDETLLRGLDVGAKTLAMDVLPGAEISSLFSGTSAAGAPLTNEQTGEALGMGLVKSLPVAQGIGRLTAKIGGPLGARMGAVSELGAVDRQFMRSMVTEGMTKQLKLAETDPNFYKSAVAAVKSTSGETLRDVVRKDLALDAEASARMDALSTEHVAPTQLLHTIYNTTLGDEIITDVLKRAADERRPITWTQAVGESIRDMADKGIDPATHVGRLTSEIANKFGITTEQAARDVSNTLMNSVGYSAESLQQAALSARIAIGEQMIKASKGGPEGLAAMERVNLMERMGKAPASGYTKAVQWLNNDLEGFRRAMMVGQLATAIRNLSAQAKVGVLQIAEDTITGVVEAAVGLKKGESRPISSYFNDLAGDFSALVSSFNKKDIINFNKFLESMPFVRGQLYNTVSTEIANTTMYNIIRNRGDLPVIQALKQGGALAPKTLFNTAASTVNAVNYMQETAMRRLFFLSRLESNIKRRGIKHFDELLDVVKNDPQGLGAPLKVDIANALEHSLKQTFAYSPEAGLAKHVLDFYKKVPMLTALAHPFPRFWFNQYQWQLERAPSIWFNLFSPKFRDVLMQGAEGGFASAEAARALGRATGGLFLLNGAWVIRNSESAGPKYYQINAGHAAEDPAETRLRDLRSEQPFASYLFVADQIHRAKNDLPNNLTPNEFADALIGVRRLGEMPLFAAMDVLRSVKSDDPESLIRALKTPAGQYLSSFFTPLHTLRELGGGVADLAGVQSTAVTEAKAMRDVQSQELTGPTRSIIEPTLAPTGLTQTLPKRYDPYTGKPYTQEHPFLRQLFGQTLSDVTKFQSMMYQFPSLSLPQVIGDQGHPVANNLVAKHMGQILKFRAPDGRYVGDVLAEQIEAMNLPFEAKKLKVKELLTALRDIALPVAQAENPKAFVNKYLDSKFPAEYARDKHRVRRELTKLFGEPKQ